MKIIFIECSDFETFPTGGQLTYLKSLIPFIDVEPHLVGVSVDSRHSVGKWRANIVNGRQCHFLPIGFVRPESNLLDKFIPYRMRFVLWLRKYREQILSSGAEAIYVQTQEAALSFLDSGLPPVVLRLAGATNPLKGSRFSWARVHFLEALYERLVTRRVLPYVAKVVAINQECVQLCQTIGATDYAFIPINPEYKVGGSVDIDYVISYVKKYTTRTDSRTKSYTYGRIETTKRVFKVLYNSGMGHLFLGLGPGSYSRSVLDPPNWRSKHDRLLKIRYGLTPMSIIAIEYGILGVISYSIIVVGFVFWCRRYYYLEKDSYWKAFAAGSFGMSVLILFLFYTYHCPIFLGDAMPVIYFYIMAVVFIRTNRYHKIEDIVQVHKPISSCLK